MACHRFWDTICFLADRGALGLAVLVGSVLGIACGVGQGGIVLEGLVFALGVLVCGRSAEHAMARWLNRGDNFERDQGDTHHTR